MVLVLSLQACDRPEPAPPPPPPPAFSLRVDPPGAAIETGPAGGTPVQFVATAIYEDGREEPLDLVEWTLSNRSAGTLSDDGLFTPSTENGGISWVTARLDDVEAQATVEVTYHESLNASGVDETLFTAPVTPSTGRWRYPADGVNFPRNTPSIDFQWAEPYALASRLVFRSELTELEVFTNEPRWLADGATWERIVSTNAGGQVDVTLQIAVAGAVLEELPITLTVNRMDATGSILYWSTSVSGFVEIPYGGAAVPWLTQAETGRCQGCHAISSTGIVAFTYEGGDGALSLKRLDDKSDVNANAAVGNFKTFSPDGAFLLATDHGNLRLLDGATGSELGVVRALADATHVDWSPDGQLVALTLSDGHTSDWTLATPSRIAVMEHLGGGTFADPVVLFDPPDPQRAYYPAWSPDGQWIAFNVSTGDCYDDPDATVWVIDRDGERPAIRLDAMNDLGDLTNSWPRWGPLPDDDVLWIAVASRRAYGFVTSGTPQIWVAGFDPARAEQGVDPSWPAFWLPGQDTLTANHIPVWIP